MKHYPVAHHTLTLILGVGAGFYPLTSFGLSLGDLQVDSKLNEALHARIEIVGVTDEEWRQIHASVAPSTYSGDGPDHPEILDVLSFRATEDAEHRRFIEVNSSEVLTEPLFDLPIQVSASSLQVIRSYSVLLDPAVQGNATLLAQSRAAGADGATGGAVGAVTVATTGASVGVSAGAAAVASGASVGASAVASDATVGGAAVASGTDAGAAVALNQGAAVGDAGIAKSAAAVVPVVKNDAAASGAKKAMSARSAKKHRHGTHKRSSSKVAKARRAGSASATAPSIAAAAKRAADVSGAADASGKAAANGQRAQAAAGVAKSAVQEQLENQLTTLQQTLDQMQATIRAQDAEIANLTREIALQQQLTASRRAAAAATAAAATSAAAATGAAATGGAVAVESESSEGESARKASGVASKLWYWLGGVAAVLAAAIAAARYARKRKLDEDRDVRFEDIRVEMDELSARMHSQEAQAVEKGAAAAANKTPFNNSDLDLGRSGVVTETAAGRASGAFGRQSAANEARVSGTFGASSAVGGVGAFGGSSAASGTRAPGAFGATGTSGAAGAGAVAAGGPFARTSITRTARLPRATPGIEVTESLSEEDLESATGMSSGLEDWRTQSALLLADIATESLPGIADETVRLEMTGETRIAEKETNSLSLADLERAATLPAQGTSSIGPTPTKEAVAAIPADHGASNREVAEMLENTLDIAPDRVDVQLKLLEIYHQEALGNRDNFLAMLRKLSLDPKTLTPAQLLHIETLQRTLDDGHPKADVAEAAV